MNLSGNTVLVTGGASGIGYALAERFYSRGNNVIICGRREDVLKEAQERLPGSTIRVCDLASATERAGLFEWAIGHYPDLNVLVNNAGIQRRVDMTQDEDWEETRVEFAINLDAPIHLSRLFYSHLAAQESAAIINVTSGLSFAPLANVPVYCATKAALHSFTLSLRHQLSGSSVEVIEVIPPAVDTDLGGPGLHTFGVNVNEFADAVFEGIKNGQNEIAYGTALTASKASREELDKIHQNMNRLSR
jgi:uncharacterized oxidoreductase